MHALLAAAEETAEAANHLPIPPFAYGLIGFGALLLLLATTYAFRSVGERHHATDDAHGHAAGGHAPGGHAAGGHAGTHGAGAHDGGAHAAGTHGRGAGAHRR